ncbi:unnamed protein product [Cladocopium goreaui]|uniref:Polycystin-2 n=1 Tax=Cladocopium goreaui TaxID=2562237 RepID=A0A9P1CST2_9DINO|nr:unnamed protein product [Cladocopium goreaui]
MVPWCQCPDQCPQNLKELAFTGVLRNMRCLGSLCLWICGEAGSSVPSRKSTLTFTEDSTGNEPETEPEEEMTMKQKILHRLTRMNTGDLLRQIRRNISSYQVLSDADLSWDAEDMATEPEISFAVRELQAYFSDWQRAQTDKFWQRKSHKVVIAVVVCEEEDSSLVALRGMNTEVSLPSGSLCAERAGIARAASEFFAAKSIKAIAVLDPSGDIAPLWPCEVCQSWLAKIREQNPRISVVAFPSKENDFKTILVQKNGKDVRPPTAVSRMLGHDGAQHRDQQAHIGRGLTLSRKIGRWLVTCKFRFNKRPICSPL